MLKPSLLSGKTVQDTCDVLGHFGLCLKETLVGRSLGWCFSRCTEIIKQRWPSTLGVNGWDLWNDCFGELVTLGFAQFS